MVQTQTKILKNFETQTGRPIPARRSGLVLINKKKTTCYFINFILPASKRVKMKESEKTDEYLDFARKLKKSLGHENYEITIYIYNSYRVCSICPIYRTQLLANEGVPHIFQTFKTGASKLDVLMSYLGHSL